MGSTIDPDSFFLDMYAITEILFEPWKVSVFKAVGDKPKDDMVFPSEIFT